MASSSARNSIEVLTMLLKFWQMPLFGTVGSGLDMCCELDQR